MERNSGGRVSAAPFLDVWGERKSEKRRIQSPLPVPEKGDIILVNEQYVGYKPFDHECFNGEGGPRKSLRRYIGRVMYQTSNLIVIDTITQGVACETITDFRLGFVRYVKLSSLPEDIKSIPYNELVIDKFADAFVSLLKSIS